MPYYESLCNKESFLCQKFAGPIQTGAFSVAFLGIFLYS
jgi:hypothetical protein